MTPEALTPAERLVRITLLTTCLQMLREDELHPDYRATFFDVMGRLRALGIPLDLGMRLTTVVRKLLDTLDEMDGKGPSSSRRSETAPLP